MKKHRKNATIDLQHYQEWVDYDMKHYHKISDKTMDDIRKAGLTVTKDQYGDYEVTAACKPSRKTVKADTVKKDNKWVNRGDTGKEHGEFDTKKKADAQRKAMYATGYKGKVTASVDDADDITWILERYADDDGDWRVNVATRDQIDSYYKVVKNVRDAERFNYHSDYWGSADGYQEDNVSFMDDLEPYVGKEVTIDFDGGPVPFKVIGIAIDRQYNSLSHTKLLVEELSD